MPDGSSSGSSSTSSSSGTSSTGDSGSGGGSADTTTEPARDLDDAPDFGGTPAGCKGKIDFLFVISRTPTMAGRQAQLALAVPQFIDAIEAKFADFDYHIMVVDGDGEDNDNGEGWGNSLCNDVCPNLACKNGDDCCEGWGDIDDVGKPCCGDPNYPCEDLDLVTACDWTWGAGTIFPAGPFTADKPCPIDGGRRYLVRGQTDLDETFACVANVGTSGWDFLGQALTAAVQKPMNEPGGCNAGFLREDALLMVTTIYTNPDQDSEGWPAEWTQAVIDAKGGDENSVVMLNIGRTECDGDRICEMVKMFTYHHLVYAEEPDYGPGFVEAASLVETACAGFVPPPG